jgi:hypothetical protein
MNKKCPIFYSDGLMNIEAIKKILILVAFRIAYQNRAVYIQKN